METRLTIKERKFAQKIIDDSKNIQNSEWPQWAGMFILALGGFLIIFVSFITLGKLDPVTIKYGLLPGLAVGTLLILFAAFIHRKAEEEKVQKQLISLVIKLMK